MTKQHPATMVAIVTFTIGEQVYGLPVAHALEIVFLPTMLTIAGAPPHVCGLLNRRGQHLPVIDGRSLLGEQSECSLSSKIIVIGDIDDQQNQTPRFGLLVDHVHDVSAIVAGDTTSLSEEVAGTYLTAVVSGKAGSILLFDVAQLMKLAPRLGETTAIMELSPVG